MDGVGCRPSHPSLRFARAVVLLNSQPPFDIERALRMYGRAVAAYEQCGPLSRDVLHLPGSLSTQVDSAGAAGGWSRREAVEGVLGGRYTRARLGGSCAGVGSGPERVIGLGAGLRLSHVVGSTPGGVEGTPFLLEALPALWRGILLFPSHLRATAGGRPLVPT